MVKAARICPRQENSWSIRPYGNHLSQATLYPTVGFFHLLSGLSACFIWNAAGYAMIWQSVALGAAVPTSSILANATRSNFEPEPSAS
jgi:hypothetical protein